MSEGRRYQSQFSQLAEAFTILDKYEQGHHRVAADQNTLQIHVDPNIISKDDKDRLVELGFMYDHKSLYSFYHGMVK